MGCSSSAQTQVKDGSRPASTSPDANGLKKCDDNLPITKENDTISDQCKLVAIKKAELEPHGTKLSEGLAKEEADVLIPGITSCALSTCQRVDPEGTEPQPVTLEETLDSSGPLSPPLLEAGEPLPVEPSKEVVLEPWDASEAADGLVPQTIHDSKPESVESSQQDTPEPVAEESANLVMEIVKELQVDEEEQQTEGETGEKTETEMHHEIVSAGSETKEEETGEATAPAATEEIEATNNEE
ncbi:glutamate-rich protein 5 isoform X1 [Pogona vitticeps]